MTNIIYTNFLLKKDIQLFNFRMNLPDEQPNNGFGPLPLNKDLYGPFLKCSAKNNSNNPENNSADLNNTDLWKQFLDKFGIVSIALDEQYNNDDLRKNFEDAFEQLSKIMALTSTQIGCGKLHIVVSSDMEKSSGFYRADNEMMIYFKTPDDINKLAHEWFYFADHMQTLGISQEPQTHSINKSSSMYQLLNLFDKKGYSLNNIEGLVKEYNQQLSPQQLVQAHSRENQNTERFARSFEVYVQSQLDKSGENTKITTPSQYCSMLYPESSLKDEQNEIWKMVINKFHKKLQSDKTRQIVKLRLSNPSYFDKLTEFRSNIS
jgi:hypothetical protein